MTRLVKNNGDGVWWNDYSSEQMLSEEHLHSSEMF